jgi:peptidoglycan/xylan/chitin deacetylase (PgdA/CDA1 family)
VNNRLTDEFSVVLTFDDGNLSDVETVYPKLKANKIKATFFMLAGMPANSKYWGLMPELLKDGFTIGSHGFSHSDFMRLKAKEQQAELLLSKNELESKIGRRVNYFAFPFGRYTNESLKLAKLAGYTAVLTTDVKLNYPESDPYVFHRWSVKQNTSLKEFEGMVTNQSVLRRKIKASMVKKGIKKVIGKNLSDYLNVVFDI